MVKEKHKLFSVELSVPFEGPIEFHVFFDLEDAEECFRRLAKDQTEGVGLCDVYLRESFESKDVMSGKLLRKHEAL